MRTANSRIRAACRVREDAVGNLVTGAFARSRRPPGCPDHEGKYLVPYTKVRADRLLCSRRVDRRLFRRDPPAPGPAMASPALRHRGSRADLRFQVMADGFFHFAMYVLMLVGLGLLWRQRRDTDKPQFAATAMAWGVRRLAPLGRGSFALAAWSAPNQDGQPKPALLGPALARPVRYWAAVTWLAVPEKTATGATVTSSRSRGGSFSDRHRRRRQPASGRERDAASGSVQGRDPGKRDHARDCCRGRLGALYRSQRNYLGRQI